MPRRNSPQSPPKYCQYKRTDQAYVRINGRFIYLGPYNSEESREAYRRVVAEWMITGQAPSEEGEEAGITIVELMVQYWQHVEKHYRKNGQPTAEQDSIRSALRRLKMLYGSTQVIAFRPGNLRNVRQQMIDEGLARTNINKLIDRIRRMFRWAESHDLIPQGKWESLRTVEGLARGRSEARETDPVRPVPTEAIEAVRGLVSRQVKAMIDLQLLTGMRPGEVVIMRACDIEDMSAPIWTYVPETHKTEHHDCERIIEIGRRGQMIIKRFLTTNTTAYLFSPQDAVAERTF